MTDRPRALQPPGRYPPRPRPIHAPAASATTADIEAAKRILSHARSFLELLADDLRELQVALDQAPGRASELATRLLDDAESWRY